MTVLTVNACPRGDASRTLRLLKAFENTFREAAPEARFLRQDLDRMRLQPLDGETLWHREAVCDAQAWEDPLIGPANAFVRADLVVIAAPYWDLSFPSALKVWIEHIFIRGLTFIYRDDQPVGLARAKSVLYLTTAGSVMLPHGVDYVRDTMQMLGVRDFHCVSAEGLDLDGADVPRLMADAVAETERRARALAEAFRSAD